MSKYKSGLKSSTLFCGKFLIVLLHDTAMKEHVCNIFLTNHFNY